MDGQEDRSAFLVGERVTLIGMFANAALVVAKIGGGFLASSQALVADGVHSLSDFVTDFFVLFGLRYAGKPADEDHHYGHSRYEPLAALTVGILLLLAGLGLMIRAAFAVTDASNETPGITALIVAGLSLVTKEILFHYTRVMGERLHLSSLIANAWHHRSDSVSSIIVFLGLGLARYQPEYRFLDKVAAIVVGMLIVKVGIDVIREQFHALSDASPDEETYRKVLEAIESVEDVRSFKNCRARLSGRLTFIDVDILVDPYLTVQEGHEIAQETEDLILKQLGRDVRVMVHLEPFERSYETTPIYPDKPT